MAAIKYCGATSVDNGSMRKPSADFASRSSVSIDPAHGQRLQFAGVDFGRTSILKISASPGVSVVRHRPRNRDTLICLLMQEGEATFDFGVGGLAEAGPGSCWLGAGFPELGVGWRTDGQMVVAVIPLQVLRDFGLMPSVGLTLLRSGSALLRPAADFLASIVNDPNGISSVAAYFMEKLIHEMVGGLILENHGAGPSGRKPTLYDRAVAYIVTSAGDATLTPESISQNLNVSLRQLQREFQRMNESVADRIRQARVELALRLLKDRSLAMLSLEQIAVLSGFTSLGHLRRTLRRGGVGSPRDVRAVGKGLPHSVLI